MNGIIIAPAEALPVPPGLYAWGIQIIRMIQTIKSPGLTAFMKIITSLGAEYFYIVLVLLVFWCVDEKKGFRLGLLIIVSAWLNLVLKYLFGQPRPFDFDPALGLAFEPSPGLPSGHAQMSLCFWIALAHDMGRKNKLRPIIWPVSIFIILLIGFTRLYLGVHFPTDVFGGWIIGAAVLVLFYFLEKPVNVIFVGKTRVQIISAAATALIMNAVHPEDTSLSALLLGLCAGYCLMRKHFPFYARGNPSGGDLNQESGDKKPGLLQLVLRFVIGLAGAAIIYLGLRIILPGKDSYFSGIPWLVHFYELARFVRYGLLGFWAAAGAPRLFQQIGLAPARDKAAAAEE